MFRVHIFPWRFLSGFRFEIFSRHSEHYLQRISANCVHDDSTPSTAIIQSIIMPGLDLLK